MYIYTYMVALPKCTVLYFGIPVLQCFGHSFGDPIPTEIPYIDIHIWTTLMSVCSIYMIIENLRFPSVKQCHIWHEKH